MLALRNAHPALRHGDLVLGADDSGDLLLFDRVADGERLLCAFNLGDAPAVIADPRFAGADVLAAEGLDGATLAPWGGVIATVHP